VMTTLSLEDSTVLFSFTRDGKRQKKNYYFFRYFILILKLRLPISR